MLSYANILQLLTKAEERTNTLYVGLSSLEYLYVVSEFVLAAFAVDSRIES